MSADFDVIVVGGGGAGIAAALAAVEAGARTLLLDAGPKLGGSTALSGGVFYAAGTSIQQANGFQDDADAMYHHYMTLSRYSVAPSLVRKLCNESAATLDWLISLGVRYTNEGLYFSGCDAVPRGHRPLGAGAEIVERLEGALSQHPVDVALETRVTGLIKASDGSIAGIRCGEDEISAGAVVLTTGGFGGSKEMLTRHFPDHEVGGDYLWYVGAKTCRGDGLNIGAEAGAEIVGHNRGQLSVTHGFSPDNEVQQPGWLVHVNRHGKRFVDETQTYAIVAEQLRRQPGHECYSIFDEDARLSLTRASDRHPTWERDLILRYLNEGKLTKAASLADLAQILGLPVRALKTTVDRYNEACAAGRDPDFLKNPAHMRAIANPPFYAARLKPAILGLTATGLSIDTCAKVLDPNGIWVKGLFAAGETTGGVISEIYTASGNSIANSIIFGRTAGAGSAAFTLGIKQKD
ncbi:FAD-dependent oxidoreductase [Aminobacter aminovorans]|uniref:Fumarate reductase flavoprotein subunit n=1 Tax=Aminobacter aminovorans TaxID=83263 RepID=A0AAC8YWU0_AMIAI|nr:FAD-dependent oxidoreductase [Aminobacter aminovorans]AMS45501.1 Fumarate reductase flavoprotein subunit [Aminobacter aminovorans]MBB3708709.1 fumarate reductase flavoprotein subunit [Aminobacter aminovorans]